MSSQNNRLRRGHWRGPSGPEALLEWVRRWRDLFKAGYRQALAEGYLPDVVVWAMPRTASLEDPPLGFDLLRRDEARRKVNWQLPCVRGTLDDPPNPGMFYIVASRAEGRFKGTLVAMLPVPEDGDDLPPVAPVNPPISIPELD
jgi:hypothetical protein